MSLLIVDREKCKKDGICALECPRRIIRQPKNEFPSIVPGDDELCLNCGHCVAVCPHDAMRHEALPVDDFLPVNKGLELNEEQVTQFLRSRRSIRVYKDKPVEREKLARIIDLARYAPTGSNSQSVQWTVINGADKVRAVTESSIEWMRDFLKKNPDVGGNSYYSRSVSDWETGYDLVLRSAPSLIVASAPNDAGTAAHDVIIALSYLELAALPLGLGTCWAGILYGVMKAHAPLREEMGIPMDHPHYYPMMIGYPKFSYPLFPSRKEPRINWR